MPDKILVVDDEVEIADLIEVYLNNENYSVFKFYSAKEALECINTTNLDLAMVQTVPRQKARRVRRQRTKILISIYVLYRRNLSHGFLRQRRKGRYHSS